MGEIAEARGIPHAQIALAWLLHKPAVTTPIVGATKLHHLEEAVAALDVKLSGAEIETLEPLLGGNSYARHSRMLPTLPFDTKDLVLAPG